MDINNREYAFIIWIVMIIITISLKKDIRDSSYQVINAFKQKPILIVLGLAVIWVSFWIVLFYEIGVWTTNNLKTTLVWIITYAFVTVFEVHKIKNSKYYFKAQIKETIGLSTLLMFILELHSFSFAIEFIMLPIITALGLMAAVGNVKQETKYISTTINIILGIVVVFHFFHSLYISIISLADTFSWINLTEFLTPILLSFSFMPFIYMLYLYQGYETKLIGLRVYFNDEDLFNYARRLAILYFRTDLDGLNRWIRDVNINEIRTKKGLKSCMKDVKSRKKIELNPPTIAYKDGWSPSSSKNFLISKGVNTNDYHFSSDTWLSYSPMIEIGDDDLFSDNISYYLYGNESTVHKLKLRAHINKTPISESSKETIHELTKELISKALADNSIDINKLFNKLPVSIEKNRHVILITKEDFVSKNGGYTLEVEISVSNCTVQNDKNPKPKSV